MMKNPKTAIPIGNRMTLTPAPVLTAVSAQKARKPNQMTGKTRF